VIIDDGIVIFRKIKNALNLEDERESALHLSKGKFTKGLAYIRDNTDHDWFLETNEVSKLEGT
jgi:hypothetical protein